MTPDPKPAGEAGSQDGPSHTHQTQKPSSSYHHQSHWLLVMCLTGVDYFSTIGYQPSIAYEAAGLLAPLATLVLVIITLFGALPVYRYVAARSPHGQGSIGMLEKLVSGWKGKFLVLVILGFAATDFVITKTISAADAAEHIVANPFVSKTMADAKDHWQIGITLFLLAMLAAVFLKGFREVIGIAVIIVAIYLFLNVIIILAGLQHLLSHQELVSNWWKNIWEGNWYLEHTHFAGPSFFTMLMVVLIIFPKLALGLSGFETGVAVMSSVRGDAGDTAESPAGRIRGTKKLLFTVAMIMSVLLMFSSIIVACLVPPEYLANCDAEGHLIHRPELAVSAKDRAMAFLAHNEGPHKLMPWLFGDIFGTIYDISTVVILWFAGASAMAGLLNLVPQYLPRYGMAPDWAKAARPLILTFTTVNFLVTWFFKASVKAQTDAYATGVLMLITSACFATVIGKYQQRQGPWWKRISWYFLLITLVFVYTTILNVWEKPVGIMIASVFILMIITVSVLSRVFRARELRFAGFDFADEQSKFLWQSLLSMEFPILVPHRPGRRSLLEKEAIIRKEHRLPDNLHILFLEVDLHDASDFLQVPKVQVTSEEGRYILKITRAASIAHTVAAVALELGKVGKPPEIHFGWTEESPIAGTLGFLILGEGNVPWMVHELIRKAQPDLSKRPSVVIGGI